MELLYEHIYSSNQATRQTKNRLYTQGKEVFYEDRCIFGNFGDRNDVFEMTAYVYGVKLE